MPDYGGFDKSGANLKSEIQNPEGDILTEELGDRKIESHFVGDLGRRS
jgi:hypothetical protein